MELGIIAVVLVVGGYFIYSTYKRADKNADGKIDAAEATAIKQEVKAVVAKAKSAADVNQDGKVDAQDAKVAVKKAAVKAKTAVKKPGARRPRSKA